MMNDEQFAMNDEVQVDRREREMTAIPPFIDHRSSGIQAARLAQRSTDKRAG
jgi:hypothetical protein